MWAGILRGGHVRRTRFMERWTRKGTEGSAAGTEEGRQKGSMAARFGY